MSDVKLGQLIEGDPGRDAIHVAVAPVVASTTLSPGAHVGLMADGTAGMSDKPIGIVDPFLTGKVAPGEKFWLCLYQGTVTGMRHAWSHPGFAEDTEAVKFMNEYAKAIGVDYLGLMDTARRYLEFGDELIETNFKHEGELPVNFWKHYETLTGIKGEGSFFGCCI